MLKFLPYFVTMKRYKIVVISLRRKEKEQSMSVVICRKKLDSAILRCNLPRFPQRLRSKNTLYAKSYVTKASIVKPLVKQ